MKTIKLANKSLLLGLVTTAVLAGCGGGSSEDTNNNNGSVQKDALIKTTTLATGDAECTNGGLKITAGYDDNNNNVLEVDEFVSNKVICHDGTQSTEEEGKEIFNQALVSIALIAKEDQQCASGGQKVLAGIDSNNNSILEPSEVTTEEVLCSIGADFAPGPIINSIVASPAIVATGSDVTLTATLSNLEASDTVTWQDEQGNTLTVTDVNAPHILTTQVGSQVGTETYTLLIETTNNEGVKVLQTKNIEVTVAQAPAPTQSVMLDSQQVFLLDGYNTSPLTGDVSGTVIYAKPQAVAAQAASGIPTPADTELAGFIAERGAMNAGKTALEILHSSISAFQSELTYANVTQTSQTILENGDINASYKISFYYNPKKLTELLDSLIQQVAVKSVGGSASALVPAATEIAVENYQLDINISYDPNGDSAVITSTLVASDKVPQYSELIVSTTSESIKASASAKLALQNDTFNAINQTVSKADFLFVIDNSGSMSDEQQAISDLTSAFTQTIQNAGVDFMVGTITTDSDELRGNGFTNDISQIEQDFLPGTWGSVYERGIYFAEKALQPGGTVDLAGFPRQDASLSVVIMSDERSQYLGTFDPNDNLFIDNGYRVYAIVNPNDANSSQYDDL
ncbi:DUF7151 family protein, partial [Vibrio sp.]|uniref:DUF7151 family protein n=1 Tax=Vibrio sp. TaxID=678 RepID=UPI003D0FC06D